MDPQSQLYTRQQIASLTGIDASSLNYWSREGLLVPIEGGAGKGSHRRFDWVQVNIVAILGELRGFRLNISSLRSLAELLQAAARLGGVHKLHPSNYSDAAQLASTLARYRAGEQIPVPVHGHDEKRPQGLYGQAFSDWLGARRPAASEDEIIGNLINAAKDYDPLEEILAAAEQIGPGMEVSARVYADLVYDVLAPGYTDSYSWLLALKADDSWHVAFGDGGKFFDSIHSEAPEEFGAAIFLPVSGVIRRLWGLKTPEQHRRERDERYIKGKLEAAGIDAAVVVHEDENEGFSIEAPGVERSVLAAALKNTRFDLTVEVEQQ